MELLSTSYISLFAIVALGFLLGKIKIKGVSLDVSAVIFVALIFGHYGVQVSKEIQYIGLLLFIFTVGIQAGPGFFQAFRSKGMQLTVLTIVLISTAALITIGAAYIFKLDTEIAVGLFTGALTSTPGLAVAIDATNSSIASIGYGIAYPFGVIGVILFVKLLPGFLKSSVDDAEQEIENETLRQNPELISKIFRIDNENIAGKTIDELKLRDMTGTSISRVKHDDSTFTPTQDTRLALGDKIKAVGTIEALNSLEVLVGKEVNEDIPLGKEFEVLKVLVSNKELVNRTISQLNLFNNYNATVTRIKRSGITISPRSNTVIQMGDKLTIACDRRNMRLVTKFLGNDDKKLSDTDFLPIALGIILGFLVGKIQVSFSNSFSFNLGLTGGVLITALVLSKIGKTGPILWTMSGTANNLLRLIGLLFFLSAVGTNAGANLVETYKLYGFKLFYIGGLITLLPMIITVVIARMFFKINLLILLGALTGSMTSTPGLATVDNMTKTNSAQIAYATVYPIAMVLLIIFVHIISSLHF